MTERMPLWLVSHTHTHTHMDVCSCAYMYMHVDIHMGERCRHVFEKSKSAPFFKNSDFF